MIRHGLDRALKLGRLRGNARHHPRELEVIAGCVDRLLKTTGVSPADIDHVFLTGGWSFVPAVRQIFIGRFGLPKITGGEELTSVATGLALRAKEQWPV